MIPKIIHQLWIGEKKEPTIFMNTWKDINIHFNILNDVMKNKKYQCKCNLAPKPEN